MRVTIKGVGIHKFLWAAVAVIVCALSLSVAMAEQITIAVAASMKPAMIDIVKQFNARHPKDEVRAIYGSSGKLAAQIQSGAPFDMFFSADLALPIALKKEGWGATDPVVYAVGRLVIWSSTTDATKLTLEKLAGPAMRKIAIANPARAPYGMRAKEALVSAGVWDKLQGRLVFGESVEHATHMVSTGAADAGIIALSSAQNPEILKQGGYHLIDEHDHQPLTQAFILTKRAKGNIIAQQFASHMQAPESKKILEGYGFTLPSNIPHFKKINRGLH